MVAAIFMAVTVVLVAASAREWASDPGSAEAVPGGTGEPVRGDGVCELGRGLTRGPAKAPDACWSAAKRVLGMPDYAAYLAHLRVHHPDCPVPTEREFYDQYVQTRYGDGATRCC